MEEEWTPVVGLKGKKLIASSFGRVASLRPSFSHTARKPRILRGGSILIPLEDLDSTLVAPGQVGYSSRLNGKLHVVVSRNRLVCLAWHGLPPDPSCIAAHLDGDTANDAPENLAWVRRSELTKLSQRGILKETLEGSASGDEG